MKTLLINKILLGVEIVPTVFLLLLSLLLVGDQRPEFLLTLILSILSMVSLIYIIISTILESSESIENRFVYLSHIGFVITILGLLVIIVHGNELKSHSPNMPFSIFSLGLVACVPYLHVMIINDFFARIKN